MGWGGWWCWYFWLFSIFFDGFTLFCFRVFLSIKNALIQSIFGLEKCSLHENGVEFHQKLIGNVFRWWQIILVKNQKNQSHFKVLKWQANLLKLSFVFYTALFPLSDPIYLFWGGEIFKTLFVSILSQYLEEQIYFSLSLGDGEFIYQKNEL